MPDLDQRIRRLADQGRIPLIKELTRMDTRARSRAKAGRGARRDSPKRNRAEEAHFESERLGRIIYFLRFRTYALGAPPQDIALCDALASALQGKDDWTGSYDA